MNDLADKVIKIISENLLDNNVHEIAPDKEFVSDLGFDSIKFMGLFFALEEEFNIEIMNSPDNYKFFSVITVEDIIEILTNMV